MKPLCDLQEWHGVDLGAQYRNDIACSTFVSYIAAKNGIYCLKAYLEYNFSVYKQMAVQIQGMSKMSSTQFSTLNPNQTTVGFVYVTNFHCKADKKG